MSLYSESKIGDLVNVVAYYRDQIICNGIFIEECKHGTYLKILSSEGEIREFDTVYYYLETLN